MNSTRKTVALLSTSALAVGAAHGAVVYTPINLTISGVEALDLDLNQDGTPDYQIQWNAGNTAKPYIFQGPSGSANTSAFVLSASSNQDLPLTPIGTLINGSYESAQTAGYFNENGSGTGVGGWTGGGYIDGYVGLELTSATATNYGWAHFIYNAAGVPANDVDKGMLTLVDTAIETAPGVGIRTGQTAETGAPVVVTPPSSQTGYLGGTAQLTVVAAGNPAPSFSWQAGAVQSGIYTNLPIGGRIADATINTDGTMNTLTIQNLTPANMADYVVVVSNASGAVTSSIPATLTVVPTSDSPATLVHRYSFQDAANSSTFVDSVGGSGWNGSLSGTATLTGSNLVLDGSSGCYAYLPSDITSNYTQMTVEFWADIGNNPPYTRVFAFGNQSGGGQETSGLDFSPYENGGYQNLNFTNIVGDGFYANNNVALTNTVGDHVTVVVDSVNGSMYYYNGTNVVSTFHDNNLALNQTLVATSSGVPFLSLAEIDDVFNVIGASLYAVDPYLAGTIHEFRIYQGVLSPQAVALNDAVGPANYIQLSANPALSASVNAGNIVLSWPASDFNFAVQSRPGLNSGTSWTSLTNAPVLVGTNWQVSIPSSGSAQFFKLIYK